MIQYSYLLALCVSIVGIGIIDWRFRLVMFYDKVAAAKSILIGLVFFILWDLAGIQLGIFYEGDSSYVTGLMVTPHMPIEELFFLTLLVYLPLVLFEYGRKRSV